MLGGGTDGSYDEDDHPLIPSVAEEELPEFDDELSEFDDQPLVFFAEGGIAFHEGDMDTPSAGCIKLNNADAQAWFAYLQVGDEVQVR